MNTTTTITTDAITKIIDINAPVSRVWRALTDYQQFGEWFRVRIDGPFEAGKRSTGNILVPGFEHIKWNSTVQKIEPEHLFSYTWHPYAKDAAKDYSEEEPTLVVFTLEATNTGTRPAATFTVSATIASSSSSLRVGASPVVPSGKRPDAPLPM